MAKRFAIFVLILTSTACVHTPVDQPEKDKIVLVHGYGRSPGAMENLAEFFEAEGYQVYNVGYSSLTQDIAGIKQEFYSQVDQIVDGTDNTIHFVGHSMGGLLIRSYLGERSLAQLGNVVNLGSPNKGTPIVDNLKDKWYFCFGGPAVWSLSSNGSDFLSSLKQPYYNLGVIAGVVPERAESLLTGLHDGIVPLESTVVDGAKEHLVMPVSHYHMRSSSEVMYQSLHFIRNAQFDAGSIETIDWDELAFRPS